MTFCNEQLIEQLEDELLAHFRRHPETLNSTNFKLVICNILAELKLETSTLILNEIEKLRVSLEISDTVADKSYIPNADLMKILEPSSSQDCINHKTICSNNLAYTALKDTDEDLSDMREIVFESACELEIPSALLRKILRNSFSGFK